MKYCLLLTGLLFSNHLFSQTKYFSDEDLDENAKTNIEEKFTLLEIPEYNTAKDSNKVFLVNGYALSAIKNPSDCLPKNKNYEVTEINLIYTKYPVNKNLWRTDYRKLLIDRLKELFKIDSTLNSDEIEWRILLQTNCKNEKQAMLLPHGIEIVYELIPAENKTGSEPKDTLIVQKSDTVTQIIKAEKQIENFIRHLHAETDSTIGKVFNRHTEWKNSLVVMDWTGSMQAFSAEVMLWHTKNLQKSGIKNFVVFTDGKWWEKKRKLGDFGGVYFTEAVDLNKVVKLMRKARSSFQNDIQENNVEALIKGADKFKDFDELVMIADNRSCMKDYCLIDKIKAPVRIVLCGTDDGINPQYVNLAYRTGGSIHTIENDIYNFPGATTGNKEIKIDNSVFVFNERLKRYVVAGKKPKHAYQNCAKFYRKKCKC